MRILFAGYHNPHFITVTEYAEQAFAAAGADVRFFSDREFFIPGRIRQSSPLLEGLELRALNGRLLRKAEKEKPDIFFACGGLRILPFALSSLQGRGIKTILWTIDAPKGDFEPLLKAAPNYDHIFCGGSEAVELFRGAGINKAVWLPFACDPEVHKKRELSELEKRELGCDVCFVGSVHKQIYPWRLKILESVSDADLKVWGPGTEHLPAASPLRKKIMGGHTPPELWTKIYSAAKIVLCLHYSSNDGNQYPCYQASPRVYEAMACGAFLMCDAQKDILSLFEDGRHLVIFKDAEDLRKKIAYYLANPEKRETIARAGRDEVLKKHTYLDRMKVILESVRQYEK